MREPHINWSTGKPCLCTFTKHLEPHKAASAPKQEPEEAWTWIEDEEEPKTR